MALSTVAGLCAADLQDLSEPTNWYSTTDKRLQVLLSQSWTQAVFTEYKVSSCQPSPEPHTYLFGPTSDAHRADTHPDRTVDGKPHPPVQRTYRPIAHIETHKLRIRSVPSVC
jgi:hypothetical protein